MRGREVREALQLPSAKLENLNMNPMRFLIVGVLAVVTLSCDSPPVFGQEETLANERAAHGTEAPAAKTFSFTIDFGDDFQQGYRRVPWADGLTVLGAMQQLSAHPHPLEFKFRGQGETAFLQSIAGQKNGAASGRNWIFYVNGERADRSFGAQKLEVGDAVLWRFEEYP